MKKQILIIGSYLIFLFIFSAFNIAEKKTNIENNIKFEITTKYIVVSENVFGSEYSTFSWMHIGRLQKINPNFDLHSINENTNWSQIKFNHNLSENFAYRLYDQNFLIILVK